MGVLANIPTTEPDARLRLNELYVSRYQFGGQQSNLKLAF